MNAENEGGVPLEAVSFLKNHKRFLISTHVNPDGDGIGAVMALKWAVAALGAGAEIVIESNPPETFEFFENYGWIKTMDEQTGGMEKFSAVITADSPNIERLGAAASLIAEGAAILNIDHHVSNERFGAVNYIDPVASSSSEMVYRLIKSLNLSVDEKAGEYMYAGILTDTGRFRFSNTSPQALSVAAELIAAGVKPHRVAEKMYYSNTYETIKALGRLIASIQLHLGGRVATSEFDLEYLKSDEWGKVDTEGFVNYPLTIKGVEVAALLREVEPGVTRASLRSKTDFDVNALAGVFGGGGHAKAAGCTIKTPLGEAKKALLNELEKKLGA